MYCCIHCCELFHGQVYVNTAKGTPNSKFYHLSRLSKRGHDQSRGQFILKRHDVKASTAGSLAGLKAVDVYNALVKSKELRKGRDWISRLGPDVFILYGCINCKTWPLQSCSFYRTMKLAAKEDFGCSEGKDGTWRCGNCLEKWSWGADGCYRLFVIGGSPEADTMINHKYWFIDATTASIENKLQFLKGCQALKELNGRKVSITFESVLQVIKTLNEEVERRLETLPEVKVIKSAPIDSHWNRHTFKVVCEDARLSLPKQGVPIKVIDLSQSEMPEKLTMPQVDFLLDICASTLDIEGSQVSGDSFKKIKNDFLWYNTTFRRAREELLKNSSRM
jgi:hypothetical protein